LVLVKRVAVVVAPLVPASCKRFRFHSQKVRSKLDQSPQSLSVL
jgi:hypothetical protein